MPDSITDEEFSTMHREWQKEKDILLMKLESCNTDTNYVHKRIDVILKFSEKLPELFLKANPKEKKLILSTIAENITFSGKTVNIELKETFKVLQNVKKTPLFASENSNLRTPENASISIKNGSFEPQILNGADDKDIIELFGEDNMPILLPDTGKYTYNNLICIMKQCTQTYYNIRKVLGLECA